MAQLKVKQISDFVAAVGTIHNGVVGTGTATAIGDAKSEAISSAVSADVVVLSSAKSYADVAESDAVATAAGDATTKANAAKSEAISTAVSADVVVKFQAISTAFSADVVLEGRLSTAISTEKARIDALLLNSTEALDTFAEIEGFITTLDTADISGLSSAISTGDSTALSSAKSYADSLAPNYDAAGSAAAAETSANEFTNQVIIDLNFGDIITRNGADFDPAGSAADAESNANIEAGRLDAIVLSSAKSYADVVESDAIASAEAKDVVRASAASTALSNAISTEVLDRNAAILVLDNDLQAQIDALSGVNSDEVIATFIDGATFDAGKVFNLNGGHVAVFVNGLQIHEAAEGVDGWRSANGQVFTVEGLGYDLEGDDHIVVSGTLA